MGIKTLFAGVAAISAALCANAAGLSGDTGTTFAGLTAGTQFKASEQAENNKYFWRTAEATSVGTIESYTTLGAYSGTRAAQWGSTDASGVALKLDTETPLFRYAEGTDTADGATSTIDANGVYIDTLVQFGVYYETPEMVSDAKFGIWGQEIDGTVKLVVRAGKYDGETLTDYSYIITTASGFNFEAWHRITVKTSVSDGKTMFKLFIDGEAAVATTGETEFPGLVKATTISSLVFNGCGAVDDILFTKTVPEMDAIAQVGATYFTTLADAVAGANGATVTLLKSSSENITLPADGALTLAFASGAAYTGEVTTAEGYRVVSSTDEQTGAITYVSESQGMILLITQGGDETRYETLAEAVEAAAAGDTIKLLEAVALTSTINITKDLTLDLNGFDVTATDCRAFHVQGGTTAITGTGTISTVVTQGTALASSSSVIRVGSNTAETRFTLGENVTVTSLYCYGITYFGTQPQTVTLNGTVSVSGEQAAISGNGSANLAATTLVVNGTVTATQDYAIYNPQAGTTTINGTVNGGIEVKAGAVTIANGATVSALAGAKPSHSMNNNGTSTSGYAIAAVGNSSYKQPASAEIQQGAIVNGQVIVLAENNSSTSGNIASYSDQIAIPADYKWVASGSGEGYTLVEKTYVAQIGNNKYESFAEAFSAAQAGDTITLLANLELTSTINITKDLTLDLNGFNVTATDCRAFHVQGGATTIAGTGTISTIVTQGTALASSSSVIRVGDNSATAPAQFTLGKDVTVTSPYCYGISYFGAQAQTVTIDGTVSVSGVQAALSGNGSAKYAATTLVVNGTVTATQDYAIYNPQAGTTTINGTVNGGIEVKAGAVTIADGATVSALTGATPSHSMNNNGTSTSGYAVAAVGNSSYKQPASAEIQQGATVNGQVIVLAENNSSTSGNIASYSNQVAIPEGYVWNQTENGYELALAPSGYDSGDGVSTFTIDETAEADVKTKTGAADLGALVPGKTYSYAQAYAAGLIDLTAQEPIKELKPVIEIDAATNKVKVGFDTKPLNGFTITLAVYAATEPGAVDKAEAQNFEVDGNGEVQLTAPIDRAAGETKKFYKVKIVKIENK